MINYVNKISIEGTIYFDPDDVTKKHISQSSWKKVAMVVFNGDIAKYYAWFIKKRFNLELNTPLRGAHTTFINDRESDMNGKWVEIKKKWHKKKIRITICIEPKSNIKYWWMEIPHKNNSILLDIRKELGLGKPYFGLHMTIGYANEKNIDHSMYINGLINKGFIRFY